jgi:hypothetical protein
MQHLPLEIVCLGINLGIPRAMSSSGIRTKPRYFAPATVEGGISLSGSGMRQTGRPYDFRLTTA